MVTRVLEIGMSSLDQVISEAYSVDVHLAHTYLISNYEDCQSKEYCMNAYGNMTVELMRALNFYRFSNPDSHLEDICVKPLAPKQSFSHTVYMGYLAGKYQIPAVSRYIKFIQDNHVEEGITR